MLQQLTRIFIAAVALLFVFACSSALAGPDMRPATARAARHQGQEHKHARRERHKPGAAVHRVDSRRADVASTSVLLGDVAVESQYDSLAGGQAEAFRIQAAGSGLAHAVHVYISSGNAAGTVFAGLYSSAWGRPGSLLSSGSATAAGAGTWTDVSIAPIELVAGRTYWLAILGTGGTLRYRDRANGPCPSQTSAQTTLGALPSTWRTGTLYSDCPVSAYVSAAAPTPATPGSEPGLESGVTESPIVPESPAPPTPAAPVNSSAPAIAGSPIEGQALGASSGTWSNTPASYAYQWQACSAWGATRCSNVSGATSSSYTPAAGVVGHRLRVVVTAANAGGVASASSNATEVVATDPSPPPAAPSDIALPIVSGSAVEGETLSASSGSWTGSPTSYAYQWQDCNASGEGCANVSGAASSSYKLVSGDVGHTLRVVVTATNAGGSAQASSAVTGIVVVDPPPPPPAPGNTSLPTVSGSAVEGQTLSASSGSWTGSPTSYAYQWQDCNAAGEGCANVSGAASSSYKLVSGDVGHTLRVVVTATNAGGSAQASSAVTGIVVVDPPPAPGNTSLPTVSGSAVEGQTLSASSGSWTGSPTSYAYQWQDCNAAGEDCANVSGAASSTRVLASSDVGHTIRVSVKATNAGGTGEASSPATSLVTAQEKEEATKANCFASPEGCGYPGPNDEGPKSEGAAHCSALTASGSKIITKAGETVENLNITGQLTIDAAKVTVNNVCIDTNGEGKEGSEAVRVEAAGKELTIEHSTIHGENESTKSVDSALNNTSSYEATGLVAEHDDIYNCGECIHYAWTVRRSYVFNNGMRGTSEHMEDMYTSNVPGYGPAPLVAEEDTMFNPYPQTAIIFGNTNDGGGGKCENSITATKDFFAGGGWTAGYGCASATSAGGSTNFTDDRFARCLGTAEQGGSGGYKCGAGEVESTEPGPGADEHGYWAHGGYFGVYTDGQEVASKKWEGNFWDNNLHEVKEDGEEGALIAK
jgi:hypothetical protein